MVRLTHISHSTILLYSEILIHTLCLCLSAGVDNEGVYQLELDLTSLHFTHHPLFSVEHVLASRLQQACRQHAAKLASKTIEYHNERVRMWNACYLGDILE